MTRKRGEPHPDDDGLDGLGEVPAKSLAEWRERVARSTRQDAATPVTARTFTILGTPVTKKNSSRILRSRTGRPFVMPSAAYKAWENTAVLQLQSQNSGAPAITTPVELTAVVYLKRATGDLDNHLSAVCDALQKAQVIKNDKLVASFGKSRLDKDAARPRVEITITVARKQPWDCEHANEVPMRCPCKADCYCKENTCAEAGATVLTGEAT